MLWSNKLTSLAWTHGQYFEIQGRTKGSGKGGGRPQETKHEIGGCNVYSGGSELVEVIEQKVLEGEK